MAEAHPCQGCKPDYIDHATICPVLGVIAAGRCKRIRRKPEEIAFNSLYGWAVNKNKRYSISLRSIYHQERGELSAYYDWLLGLCYKFKRSKPSTGAGLSHKANCDDLAYGVNGPPGETYRYGPISQQGSYTALLRGETHGESIAVPGDSGPELAVP